MVNVAIDFWATVGNQSLHNFSNQANFRRKKNAFLNASKPIDFESFCAIDSKPTFFPCVINDANYYICSVINNVKSWVLAVIWRKS